MTKQFALSRSLREEVVANLRVPRNGSSRSKEWQGWISQSYPINMGLSVSFP